MHFRVERMPILRQEVEMGLRHRTPMAALRELRRCAEHVGTKADRHTATRLAGLKGSLRFRHLLEGQSSTQMRAENSERAQRLIARLRQAIQPEPEASLPDCNSQSEYLALQEELMRLTQIEQALRRKAQGDSPVLETVCPYGGDETMVRRIQIQVVPKSSDAEPIKRLPSLAAPLADLDGYKTLLRKQAEESSPSLPKRVALSLVPPTSNDEASNLADTDSSLNASKAAQLTVHSLKNDEVARDDRVLNDIKLSLLDT